MLGLCDRQAPAVGFNSRLRQLVEGREGMEGKGEREGKEVEELGGEGREEGGGEGVGSPFNVLPPGATDLVAPLAATATFC